MIVQVLTCTVEMLELCMNVAEKYEEHVARKHTHVPPKVSLYLILACFGMRLTSDCLAQTTKCSVLKASKERITTADGALHLQDKSPRSCATSLPRARIGVSCS